MTDQQQPEPTGGPSGQGEAEDQVVVVGPDGQPIGTIPASALPAMTQAAGDGEATRTATASATSPSWSSSRPR